MLRRSFTQTGATLLHSVFGDERFASHRLIRIPQWDDQPGPKPGVIAGIVRLRDIARHINLRDDRPKIVSDETAQRELALLIYADQIRVSDGAVQIGRTIADQSKLPLVDMLGDRKIDLRGIGLQMKPGGPVITAMGVEKVGAGAPPVPIVRNRCCLQERPEISAQTDVVAYIGVDGDESANVIGKTPATAKIPGQTIRPAGL